MGDRANIVINSQGGEAPRLFLYTHWDGYELPITLQNALVCGKPRWNDEPYLTRIIFNEMTMGRESELTGYGISTYITDNEYPLIVVDVVKGQVWLEGGNSPYPVTFEEYVGIDFTQDCPYDVFSNFAEKKGA